MTQYFLLFLRYCVPQRRRTLEFQPQHWRQAGLCHSPILFGIWKHLLQISSDPHSDSNLRIEWDDHDKLKISIVLRQIKRTTYPRLCMVSALAAKRLVYLNPPIFRFQEARDGTRGLAVGTQARSLAP